MYSTLCTLIVVGMVFSYFTGTYIQACPPVTLETADGGNDDNVTEDSGSDDSTVTEQVVAQLPSGPEQARIHAEEEEMGELHNFLQPSVIKKGCGSKV